MGIRTPPRDHIPCGGVLRLLEFADEIEVWLREGREYTPIKYTNHGLIADYGVGRQPLLQKFDLGLIDLTIGDKPARDADQLIDLTACDTVGAHSIVKLVTLIASHLVIPFAIALRRTSQASSFLFGAVGTLVCGLQRYAFGLGFAANSGLSPTVFQTHDSGRRVAFRFLSQLLDFCRRPRLAGVACRFGHLTLPRL
jgi:hypothetical protein